MKTVARKYAPRGLRAVAQHMADASAEKQPVIQPRTETPQIDHRPESLRQPLLQPRTASSPSSQAVMQLVHKWIGTVTMVDGHPSGVFDHGHVRNEFNTANTLGWPIKDGYFFNGNSYGGAVNLALDWGFAGHEGRSGWTTRNYTPEKFDELAREAAQASDALQGNVLGNDANRTLAVVRNFRSDGGMGMNTVYELGRIKWKVEDARAGLAHANLIPSQHDAVTEIKADPSEAHPGTLPTAKIRFASGTLLYFKGRGGDVENALVGTGDSAAMRMSQLNNQGHGPETGTHGFEGGWKFHLAQNVGPSAQPAQITKDVAVNGWLAAAKTAALTALSGTGDLHESNVVDGATTLKHIIDGEFLLDVTTWKLYKQAAKRNEIHNFEIGNMVPDWLATHMSQLQKPQREEIANEVEQKFRALNLDQGVVLEHILEPIRKLVDTHQYFRVSPDPLVTSQWLQQISRYHNEQDHTAHMDILENVMEQTFNAVGVKFWRNPGLRYELSENFKDGKVPLFHVTSGGILMMNRSVILGEMKDDRTPKEFVNLTKLALQSGYEHMVTLMKSAVVG